MKRVSVLSSFVVVLLLVSAAVIFGSGSAYRSFLTPRSSNGEFSGVYGDNWVVDGATVSLQSLASRGNKLAIRVGAWHPEGKPTPHVRAFVCGQLASEFDAAPQSIQEVYLKGECEPRQVRFEVTNAFYASASDTRRLGFQLHSMKVTSKLGVPVIDPGVLLTRILGVVASLFVLIQVWGKGRILPIGGCAALGAWIALSGSSHLSLGKVWGLWLLLTALGVGLGISRRSRFAGGRAAQAPGNSSLSLVGMLVLIGILGVAAWLRFYSIDFGLPSYYHPDEVPKYNAVMRMRAHGDLNPRYFLHPTLLLYMTYFMNTLLRGVGYLEGPWDQTLILAGRHGSALAGTLTVWLVYGIGKLLYNRRVGLFAAMVLAVIPLHVTCSRYVKEDALLTFFVALAVYGVVYAVRREKPWVLLLAALSVGFSASVKYSGFLSVMILTGAPWLKSRRVIPDFRYLGWTVCALLIAPLGFVAASPYVVLDYTTFLKDFGHEAAHMDKGHSVGISAASQWWLYHWNRSILPGMYWLPGVLAAVGIGVALARRRVKDAYLICLFLLFYLPAEFVRAKPAPQPERYILPCLPFLSIAAALGAQYLASIRKVRVLAPSLIILVVLLPALRTLRLASEIPVDTRAQMAAWIRENVPAGSRIAVDWKPYSVSFPDGAYELEYLPRADLIGNLTEERLLQGDLDYLVLSSLWYRRHFKQPDANPAIREHIRTIFRTMPIEHHVEAESGTYGFHNPRLTLFRLDRDAHEQLALELKQKESGRLAVTSNEARASFNWSQ